MTASCLPARRASIRPRERRSSRSSSCSRMRLQSRGGPLQVDVPARKQHADAPPRNGKLLLGKLLLEKRASAQRAGRLDDNLQPLPQRKHRTQQLFVGDGEHLVDILKDQREGHVARSLRARAVGESVRDVELYDFLLLKR